MSFMDRLKEARLKKGMTQEQIAQKIGVAKSTFTGYEKGNSEPNMLTLSKIMNALEVDANFLWQDEMNFPMSVSYSEMEHIKKYRDLDNSGKERTKNFMEWEAERINVLKANAEQLAAKDARIAELEAVQAPAKEQAATIIELHPYRDRTFCTPYFRGGISAGSGIFVLGNEAVDELEIPDIPVYKDTDYAVDVNGQSMEPDYMDGDIVLVSQGKEMHPGDVGIFIVDGSAYIKEMGHTELISRNKDFPNIPILESNSAVCMGKVIGKLERRAK